MARFLSKCTLTAIAATIVVVAGCGPAAGPGQPGQGIGITPTTNLPPAAQLAEGSVTTGAEAATIETVEANMTAQAYVQSGTAAPSAAATIEAIEETLTARRGASAATAEAQAHLSQAELIATRTAVQAAKDIAQQSLNDGRDAFHESIGHMGDEPPYYTSANDAIWAEAEANPKILSEVEFMSRFSDAVFGDPPFKGTIPASGDIGNPHRYTRDIRGITKTASHDSKYAYLNAYDEAIASGSNDARRKVLAAHQDATSAIRQSESVSEIDMIMAEYHALVEKEIAEIGPIMKSILESHRVAQAAIVMEFRTKLESVAVQHIAALEKMERSKNEG